MNDLKWHLLIISSKMWYLAVNVRYKSFCNTHNPEPRTYHCLSTYLGIITYKVQSVCPHSLNITHLIDEQVIYICYHINTRFCIAKVSLKLNVRLISLIWWWNNCCMCMKLHYLGILRKHIWIWYLAQMLS